MSRFVGVLMLVLAMAGCSGVAVNGVLDRSLTKTVWIHLNTEWESPPPDEHIGDNRYAHASLLRFTEQQQFSVIHCLVGDLGEKFGISTGDGQAILVGTWSEEDGRVEVRYRLVYETLPPVGGKAYPGPEEKATARLADGKLELWGQTFTPAVKLDFEEYERFVDPQGSRLKVPQSAGHQQGRPSASFGNLAPKFR